MTAKQRWAHLRKVQVCWDGAKRVVLVAQREEDKGREIREGKRVFWKDVKWVTKVESVNQINVKNEDGMILTVMNKVCE